MSPASYQTAPSRDALINLVAEEKGFEPLRRFLDLPVFKTGPFNQTWVFLQLFWCLRSDLNRYELLHSQDFKSCASTYSATEALKYGVSLGIRTPDPLIKSQVLYRLS